MSLQTRLSALITAIGADVKAIRAVQGSEEKRTTTYTNATITGTDVFVGFTPEANKRYHIEALLSGQLNVATNGLQSVLLGPTTGITRAAIKFESTYDAGSDIVHNISALNTYALVGNGTVAPSLVRIEAIVEVGGTPGVGNIRVGARAKNAAANAIQIFPGSFMRWREV